MTESEHHKQLKSLQTEWEQAAQLAAEQVERESELGKKLTEGAGLHVKSGVEAGGLWGTTSCGCESYSCNVIC